MPTKNQTTGKKSESTQTKVLWHARNSVKLLLEAVAAEPQGLAGVQYDVVGTSDHVPMLMSDTAISEQIINGQFVKLHQPIEVSSITAEKLREMRPDIDSLKEAVFALEHATYSDSFEFHLEIKSSSVELWSNIQKLLQQFPRVEGRTIPRSVEGNVLAQIAKDQPSHEVCLVLEDETTAHTLPAPEKLQALLDDCHPKYVSVAYNLLTQDFINAMKAANVEVGAFTVNDIGSLKGLKVDRIVTDEPVALIESIKLLQNKRKKAS